MSTATVVTPVGDFDWEAYELTDNRKRLKSKNPIKRSNDPEIQKLYDLMVASVERLNQPIENSIVKATINSVGERYAYADIGWTSDAIIDLTREKPEYVDSIQVGVTLDVIVKSANLDASYKDIEVSYSEVVKHLKYREILESIGQPVAYMATVKELIHGGYFLDIEGVEVFMPGSLGGVNKLVNFDELLGQSIYVVPINYSKEKDYIVVSHRDYLQSLIPQAMESINVGEEWSGFITGTTKFGVFVEFNQCLTGLIHKTDLSEETLNNFHSRSLSPGDEITFRIKEVSNKNRLILTQKDFVIASDPWTDIETKYKVPSEITGKVRKKTKYGIFVELEPKVVGLLHVSDIPEFISMDNITEGNDITVNLVKIDKESKKVFFKI